jgi:hypothetical protein
MGASHDIVSTDDFRKLIELHDVDRFAGQPRVLRQIADLTRDASHAVTAIQQFLGKRAPHHPGGADNYNVHHVAPGLTSTHAGESTP